MNVITFWRLGGGNKKDPTRGGKGCWVGREGGVWVGGGVGVVFFFFVLVFIKKKMGFFFFFF